MSRAIFLLPSWSAFGRQSLSPELAKAIGRADAMPVVASGRVAQLERYFVSVPAHWAPAAVTRQADVGDAADAAWLRADPAHVRPEMSGARLLGIGERLSLSQHDVDALLPALKPVFGDSGFALDAPAHDRWYLRLPREAKLPRFSAPDEALGEDIFEHQPDGAEGRRWRSLLNDVQIVLHNHPWNAHRAERGLVQINALWVWGGGVLPDRVTTPATHVASDDDLLRALMQMSGGTTTRSLPHFSSIDTNAVALYDLRGCRDLALLQRDWLLPAMRALDAGALDSIVLDTVDGRCSRLTKTQRWRFWRRPWAMPSPNAIENGGEA